MKALIVDDAKFMRAVIRKNLEKMGVDIAGEAENGLEAIELYKQTKPNIVLMDITMPEMDGIQAVKAIIQYDPKAKILMCSAMGQQSLVLDAIRAGAKNFIVKPFKETAMQDAVKKLFT